MAIEGFLGLFFFLKITVARQHSARSGVLIHSKICVPEDYHFPSGTAEPVDDDIREQIL